MTDTIYSRDEKFRTATETTEGENEQKKREIEQIVETRVGEKGEGKGLQTW